MNSLQRFRQSRYLPLASALWIESVAGAAYTFAIYSQALKLALSFSQTQLDTLAFFKSIGGNVGVLSGLLYSHGLPPWAIVLVGASLCSLGYSFLYMSITALIPPPPFSLLCIAICMASNSQTFFSTACVVTNVKNFPNQRGVVIGLLKGFLGLSGAILAQVFYAVSADDPSSFLLLLSWLPAVVSVLLMGGIRVVPGEGNADSGDDDDHGVFGEFAMVATSLCVFLCVVIVVENIWGGGEWIRWGVCLVLVGFMLLLFGVVVKADLKGRVMKNSGHVSTTTPLLCDQGDDIDSDDSTGQNRSLKWSGASDPEIGTSKRGGGSGNELKASEIAGESQGGLRRGEDHTLGQAVSSLDFWLLVVAMFCSMGSGTTAIDNLGQIGASLGYKQVEVNTFVSLISIWNFVGRFGAGLVSEFLLHVQGFSRPCCLAFSLALMCLGHLVMASAVPGSLYLGSTILGISYGAQWSLMPAITSELFGLRHFGTLYNTIAISSPVAAYVLSVQVAGFFYDKEARKQHDGLAALLDDDPLLCSGPSCFRLTFIILALVCALGCGVCFWLFARTRRFYHQVHEQLHKVD